MIDAVIIGAGIAGLSAAYELCVRGRACLLLEADARPGGVIRTERVHGFVIDAGPDSLLVQKPAAIELARELGLGDRLVPMLPPRTAYVVRNNRLVPLPEGAAFGIPTSMGALVRTSLFSWRAKLRMGLEPLVPCRTDVDDESIGAFMRRRFGQEVVAYLAEPLLAGIHAGDVERLSMRALFPRLLEAERARGSVVLSLRTLKMGHAREGAFRSFPNGIAELVDGLVTKLPSGTIRCNARVSRVRGRGPFQITIEGGETIDARVLIAATPARVSASLLPDVDAELARTCAALPYASTAVVVLAYRREQVQHPLKGSGFVVPRVERRTLMAGTWVSSKWPNRAPEGHVLLRGFVGGVGQSAALALDDRELVDRVAGELAERLAISGAPALTRVFRWLDATPQHEVGHHRWLRALEQRLATMHGLYVTGSSYRGTGIPDCVADGRAVGAEAAALLEQV